MSSETTNEIPDKQESNRNPDGTFIKGVSGNPDGRPKGRTIKEQVRTYLEENPESNAEFVKHFINKNRELAWQMIEGRPQQDVTSKGERLPTPILTGVIKNEDEGTNKEVQ